MLRSSACFLFLVSLLVLDVYMSGYIYKAFYDAHLPAHQHFEQEVAEIVKSEVPKEDEAEVETVEAEVKEEVQRSVTDKDEQKIRVAFLKEQRKRKRKIEEACNNFKDFATYDHYIKEKFRSKVFRGSKWPLRLNQRNRLLWCKVPKAGSTTWSSIFNTLMHIHVSKAVAWGPKRWTRIQDILKTRSIRSMGFAKRIFIRQLAKNGTQKYAGQKFRSLLIVRHPIDRIYSAFKEKVRDRKRVNLKGFNDAEAKAKWKEEKPSFPEFVTWLTTNDTHNHNEHWYPIYGLCDVCNKNFDFILKTENLDQESLMTLKILELEQEALPSGTMPHLNVVSTVKGAENSKDLSYYKNLLEGVKPEVLQKLLAIHQLDFDMFDYDVNLIKDAIK